MEVRLAGTGGPGGWPQPGCRCASCARARSAGRHRAPTQVLVDGALRIDSGRPPVAVPGGAWTGTGADEAGAGHNEQGHNEQGRDEQGRDGSIRGTPVVAGYRVRRVPGGWDVTGPGGGRLLVGDGPGEGRGDGHGRTAAPAGDARPYDVVLLDLLGNPAQLGALRRHGLVQARTVVTVLNADHRVRSEQELARRCEYWGVIVPHDGDVLAAAAAAETAAAETAGAGSAGSGSGGLGGPGRVLVLGGARSGKSRHAELRLAAEPRVTYLAAGPYPAGAQPADAEWAERVTAHRARRPPWWHTVESTDAAGILRSEPGVVLFDGAGTWLAAVMAESGTWDGDGEPRDGGPAAAARAEARVAARVDELLEAWRQTRARVVAVSDEVGSGVHPPTRAGRAFRDQLGWLNQRLAAESEETVLMVAGQALTLPS